MKFVILIRKVLLNYWRRIMRASMRDKFVLLFLLMPISMLGQIIQGKVLSDAGVHIPEHTRSIFRGCSQQPKGLKRPLFDVR